MKWWVTLACCLALGARAETFSAKVLVVLDGDTIIVSSECLSRKSQSPEISDNHSCPSGQRLNIRLANIDAPEKAQSFGRQSRRSLQELVDGKHVQINYRATDQYGRIVGLVSVAGIDVNREQLKRGMAWEYSNFHGDKFLVDLQEEARLARRGLWSVSAPQPPWLWRKQHPWTKPAEQKNSQAKQRVAPVMLYDMSCGRKKRCSEMLSCDEAYFYLTRCNVKTLDGDGDGQPCKQLCAEKP